MFTLHFVPDRAYYTVIYRTIYRDRILKPFAFYSLAPFGFLLSMLAFGEVGLEGEKGFISGFFLAAVLVYIGWFIAVNRRYQQHYKDVVASFAGKALEFGFDDAGVKFRYERGEVNYGWDDFKKLERYEAFWVVNMKKERGSMLLPANKMTDEMRAFVLSKMVKTSS